MRPASASFVVIYAVLAAAAVGAAFASQPSDRRPSNSASSQPKKDDHMLHQLSAEMADCMKVCGECARICAQTAHHCLGMGGEHAGQRHQTVLRDCAEICGVSVCFMIRSSPHAPHLCRECAEICRQCAQECDRLGKGDAMMEKCAEICRRCAEACEKMAGITDERR